VAALNKEITLRIAAFQYWTQYYLACTGSKSNHSAAGVGVILGTDWLVICVPENFWSFLECLEGFHSLMTLMQINLLRYWKWRTKNFKRSWIKVINYPQHTVKHAPRNDSMLNVVSLSTNIVSIYAPSSYIRLQPKDLLVPSNDWMLELLIQFHKVP